MTKGRHLRTEYRYICIDLKSYYASVECVCRGLDPLRTNLIVADASRSDQTICLAVSPSLKAIGVPSRPRLFEAKQAIRRYETLHHTHIQYITAMPRMAEYVRISSLIYSIYLRYIAPEDIHVYSIDECFIDCSDYLHLYRKKAAEENVTPARMLAITMIRDVLKTTGITATVGIGTNLYLAKVAMDIVAKRSAPDAYGVRIAELDEDTYRYILWEHRPLTDFWQVGPGKAKRLAASAIFTMGDIAERTQWDEEYFYKTFGVDGEILTDHAWGAEPVTMADIKNYHANAHSLSHGQVLPRPYRYPEARLVFKEMIDVLCADMVVKCLTARVFSWWVSYDYKSLEAVPDYSGGLSIDFYGRVHPKHSNGTIKLGTDTNSVRLITDSMLPSFDRKTDHRLLFRRLGVCADDIKADDGIYQLDFFTDYGALEKERKIQHAMLKVRQRYGANAIFKASNLLEASTVLERNTQIGGHRA
ncbi:MAG: DNA methylase [Lachnospiraceae bacterium]|nr:DNA methylase [Lachnospiraceae bacterium]